MERDVVVVLNYRGRLDTVRCVESLVSGASACSVVVVDNGSNDGVLDEIADLWPQVATVQTGDNLGFSGGMNTGLHWALDRGAETVTVLNNDTVVPDGALDALTTRARMTSAAVSPEVRYLAVDRVWFGAGTVDEDTGLPRHLGDDEISRLFQATQPRSVSSLAGCCITATADTWRLVGGFDDRYFLLFEDADWSQRARSLGVDLIVDPGVRIGHAVSASFVGASARLGLYYYARNGLLFGAQWRPEDRSRIARSYRFLRHHVAPGIVDTWRHRNRLDAARATLVVVVAIGHHLRRRYGRAPRWLETILARQARSVDPSRR